MELELTYRPALAKLKFMSPTIAMLKLLIIACVAAFLINKLIAILGRTGGAQFASSSLGKINILKDVTNTAEKAPPVDHKLIVEDNKEAVLSGIAEILEKVENFSLSSFVKSSQEAMLTITKAIENDNSATLRELVDPGFIESCRALYQNLKSIPEETYATAEVAEAYMFSNKAFITMLMKFPQYRWTFSKHTRQTDPKWYLSNISIE
jgi:predicted lipid-binding transport protein (Tim44 family)